MNAQPLLFLGDRRQRALLARLADSARRWRTSWASGANEAFEAHCGPPGAAGYSSPVATIATSCWALEVSGERLAVLLLPHATFLWCAQEPGALATDCICSSGADSLAETLEHEVASSLFTELCAVERREPLSVTRLAASALEAWSLEARAWTLRLRAPGPGREFTLLVAARRLESLAPARAVLAARDLGSRREAIGDNPVALRAIVGDASMSVTELAELAINDVLVLDQHLSEPVTLIDRHAGLPVAAGNLGRAGARRAVKIAGVPAHRH